MHIERIACEQVSKHICAAEKGTSSNAVLLEMAVALRESYLRAE